MLADNDLPPAIAAAQPGSFSLTVWRYERFHLPKGGELPELLSCDVGTPDSLVGAATAGNGTPIQIILRDDDHVTAVTAAIPVAHGTTGLSPAQSGKHPELSAMQTMSA